jgi:AcrR family transcriptional regulator
MPKKRKSARAKRKPPKQPKQDRALLTYDRLLNVAGELLGEIGIERISTNLICKRAGLTPPALYRYFTDKYAVLEALGQRLMARQNVVLEQWLARYAPEGLEAMAAHTEELLRRTASVTASEPGAVWILRALRAVPQLAHVRVESHRFVTGQLTDVYARFIPQRSREQLWRRVRIAVEFGYATDEMLIEERRIPTDVLLREAARIINRAIFD